MSDRHEMWGNLGMDLEACAEMGNKLAGGPGIGVLCAVRRLHRCAGVVYGPERCRRGSARFAHVAPGALRMRFCVLVDCDDRTRIESLAAAQGLACQRIVELERQIDASRDRFC